VLFNGVHMNGTFTDNNKVKDNTFSCICFEYSRTILDVFTLYVIQLTLILMNYFIFICMNLVECVLLD